MLTKLFSMYPLARHQNVEATLRIYNGELRDIPGLILSHALARVTKKQGSFLPTVAAIRAEAAQYVRSHMPRQQGEHAPGYNPNGDGAQPDPERFLTKETILLALPDSIRHSVALLMDGKKRA